MNSIFVARPLGILVMGLLASLAMRGADDRGPRLFAWEILPAREVRPLGWLKQQWTDDFREGLPGRLDVINRDVAQNVFAAQDREIKGGGRPSWWPGEQEGYWNEAFIHAAYQLQDTAAMARATAYVDAVLHRQTDDGYLGVYAAGSRLLPTSERRYGEGSGELHTQAQLFLALLAYYEHTERADVLLAVQKAVQLSMQTYAEGIFGIAGGGAAKSGGNSHAVNFIDPVMQLYRLTGDERYLKFAAVAYRSYEQWTPRDRDLTSKVLDDAEARFVGHGAHTAESFHWLAALSLEGDAAMVRRADVAMTKLGRQLTPGGALISDEMIDGRLGNGHDLYEYCTQAELIKSLAWIAQYRGEPLAAERAARLYLNASLGARLHPLTALEYLSRDDRMDIPTSLKKDASAIKNDGSHFQMSSIIRPSCCPASAGRPVHYYLSSAWMKRPDGSALALMNFMPSVVKTRVGSHELEITEITEYPFSDTIKLKFAAAQAVNCAIAVRLPLEGELRVRGVKNVQVEKRDGFLWLRHAWADGEELELSLELPVILEKTQDGTASFYRRGSLTYALPFRAKINRVSENPQWQTQQPSGLFEYDIRVADKSSWGYRLDPKAKFVVQSIRGDAEHPWNEPTIGLRGTMLDAQNHTVTVTLVPEAASVSRRVTFFDSTHSAEEAAQLPVTAETSLGL